MSERRVSVRVWGDFALWTRPEAKVERVSYPVMTPSGARGVLEAIYWQPGFAWVVQEIRVLRPIRTISILRNEVGEKMSPLSEGLDADSNRTSRHSTALREVDYVIVGDVVVRPGQDRRAEGFRSQFRRRVARGQCFHRPCLGAREFAAEFGPAEDAPEPIGEDLDLGLMLLDMDHDAQAGKALPHFFPARMERGVVRVPPRPLGWSR